MTMAILTYVGTFLMLCSIGYGGLVQKIIDLGFPLDGNTEWWPNMQKYEVIFESREENQNGIPWMAYNMFKTAEHVGTHVDAPFHFNKNGWKLDDIPQERFFSHGVFIDVSDLVNDNFDFVLEAQHIKNWEKKNGKIPNKSIVLVSFGWSEKYYFNRQRYFGFNRTQNKLNFPGFSQEAAELFVDRGIYGVGLDTPSLDSGKIEQFIAHQTLLGANIFGIENLNLACNEIPAKNFKLHVMPMKITEGTGAPTRVMAFV